MVVAGAEVAQLDPLPALAGELGDDALDVRPAVAVVLAQRGVGCPVGSSGAQQVGINYLGVCCGASPMLIRQVAEAVGRTTEASRFSEKMQNHFMYGDNERLPEHIVALGDRA